MNWGKIGAVAIVIAAGIWLETKLTGSTVNIDLLNPQKSQIAQPPASKSTGATHPSAQAGAANG